MVVAKRGCFESIGDDIAFEAVEAKVLLLLALVRDASDGAGVRLLQVGVENVPLAQRGGGKQSSSTVDQMVTRDTERSGTTRGSATGTTSGTTRSVNLNTIGRSHHVRNVALLMVLEIGESLGSAALVGNSRAGMKAGSHSRLSVALW